MKDLNNALAWIIIELNQNIVQIQQQSIWLRDHGSNASVQFNFWFFWKKNYQQDKINTYIGFKDCHRTFS